MDHLRRRRRPRVGGEPQLGARRQQAADPAEWGAARYPPQCESGVMVTARSRSLRGGVVWGHV